MPEWCPRCNAMLPEGLEKCPRCGKKLPSTPGPNYTLKDILGISSYVFMIVLVPVVLVLIVGILCVIFGN
jgi:hypothetical protein